MNRVKNSVLWQCLGAVALCAMAASMAQADLDILVVGSTHTLSENTGQPSGMVNQK